ncbi:MAG: hypothetical protein U0992_22425 [Planctomycetaceae bacterium]
MSVNVALLASGAGFHRRAAIDLSMEMDVVDQHAIVSPDPG